MYYLPYIYTTDSNMRCLMVNQSYLEALNMTTDDLKTMDDYYEFLKAIKENDVNGNGDASDEIPLFMRSGMIQLWGMYWGLDLTDSGGYQVGEDGKVLCGYIDDRYKEFLTWRIRSTRKACSTTSTQPPTSTCRPRCSPAIRSVR